MYEVEAAQVSIRRIFRGWQHLLFCFISLPFTGPSVAFHLPIPSKRGAFLKNIAVFSKGGWQKKGADYFTHCETPFREARREIFK